MSHQIENSIALAYEQMKINETKHNESVKESSGVGVLAPTGGSQLTPILSRKGEWGVFDVSPETFNKFTRQRAKFEKS
jgi:hypothetical protein